MTQLQPNLCILINTETFSHFKKYDDVIGSFVASFKQDIRLLFAIVVQDASVHISLVSE